MAAPENVTRSELDRRFSLSDVQYNEMTGVWSRGASLIRPTRPQFLPGTKRGRINSAIVRSAATLASRTARAGLSHVSMSPSRPWAEFATDLPEPVPAEATEWLEELARACLKVFEHSNLYSEWGLLLADRLDFGTGAMAAWDHDERLASYEAFPIGSYRIGNNPDGEAAAFFREYSSTVGLLVRQFGVESVSSGVRAAWDKKEFSTAIVVRHMIVPSYEYPDWAEPEGFDWREVYWEAAKAPAGGRSQGWSGGVQAPPKVGEGVLKLGGYHEFPIIVLRGERCRSEEYGQSSPGIDSLGTNGSMQAMESMGLDGIELMNGPPLYADEALKGRPISALSRAITFGPASTSKGAPVRPLFDVHTPVEAVFAQAERYAEEIRQFYMVDLFRRMLDENSSQKPTAEQVRATTGEISALIGPIVQGLYDDGCTPLMQRTVAQVFREAKPYWDAGQDSPRLRRPPASIADQFIRVKYTSEVAQAMKQVSLGPLERHVGFIAQLAEVNPDARAHLTAATDRLVAEHAKASGVPQRLQATADELGAVRQAEAEAQARAEHAQNAPGLARATRDLADAKVTDDSVLAAAGSA